MSQDSIETAARRRAKEFRKLYDDLVKHKMIYTVEVPHIYFAVFIDGQEKISAIASMREDFLYYTPHRYPKIWVGETPAVAGIEQHIRYLIGRGGIL